MRLTLDVTQEQLDTVEALFGHYNWDLVKITGPATDKQTTSTQTEGTEGSSSDSGTVSVHPSQQAEGTPPTEYYIAKTLTVGECPYCFCRPCITSETNRQLWWENESSPPSNRHYGLRKERYRRFWTIMFHRGAWNYPRYMSKKQIALHHDRRIRKYMLHRRDIMAKCVLILFAGGYQIQQVFHILATYGNK